MTRPTPVRLRHHLRRSWRLIPQELADLFSRRASASRIRAANISERVRCRVPFLLSIEHRMLGVAMPIILAVGAEARDFRLFFIHEGLSCKGEIFLLHV